MTSVNQETLPGVTVVKIYINSTMSTTPTFNTTEAPSGDGPFIGDDAAWALTCAFLILTMQTGFAMLECGCVSGKNVANIMIKNVCDVSIGGLAFWTVGYGLIFGKPSIWLCGLGDFFFTETDPETMGERYSHYFFHFSFASTATTIVSGAVAERMKLHSYMLFCFFNVIIYCLPAFWAWGDKGFLGHMGFFDFAGVCCVHLNGGASALVATVMLGERENRFTNPEQYVMSSPVTALTGMFMLTWAWLGFNCGSTFRITPSYWKVSAVVAVTTLNGGIGGGLMGLVISMVFKRGIVDVGYVINSMLGGLVSVTGGCPIFTPSEALLIGAIGACVAIGVDILIQYLHIDDPVGAIPVHFGAALWGTLAIGIFGKRNFLGMMKYDGWLHGGGPMLLGVNALGAVVVISFAGFSTAIILMLLKCTMGIRVSIEEERLGADAVEHGIQHEQPLKDQLENLFTHENGEEEPAAVSRLRRLIWDLSSGSSGGHKKREMSKSRPASAVDTIGPMNLPLHYQRRSQADLAMLLQMAMKSDTPQLLGNEQPVSDSNHLGVPNAWTRDDVSGKPNEHDIDSWDMGSSGEVDHVSHRHRKERDTDRSFGRRKKTTHNSGAQLNGNAHCQDNAQSNAHKPNLAEDSSAHHGVGRFTHRLSQMFKGFMGDHRVQSAPTSKRINHTNEVALNYDKDITSTTYMNKDHDNLDGKFESNKHTEVDEGVKRSRPITYVTPIHGGLNDQWVTPPNIPPLNGHSTRSGSDPPVPRIDYSEYY